jgi:hypothetical protein
MSRFDEELRGATAPLAREQLPDGVLDKSFEANGRPWSVMLAGLAATMALAVAVAWGIGRLSLPIVAEGSQSATVTCHDVDPIGARSTEYRVFFPCADGSGLASGPRVMATASPEEALRSAIGGLLNGPIEPELAAGMAAVVPDGSAELLATVELQADGLAVIGFDAGLGELSLDPRFLDAIQSTGLQFEAVTALELRLGGSCAQLFAIFGRACDHLAEPVEMAGDCPVIPPEFLPSGAGITTGRPFPGQPRTVSWGAGEDTVIQEVGERGGSAALKDGVDVTVRGYPGKARSASPEFAWVEDGCPYHVTLPGQGEYVAIDYATVYGPVVARPSPTPLPSAPFRTATIEQDGIRLSLTLDRDTTSFGERVWATVAVENIGLDVVKWGHSGSCAWPAGVQLFTTAEPMPIGRTDWPGDQGVLKNVSVPNVQVASIFTPEAFADFEGNWGCTGDLVMDEIQPGERLSDRFAWDTIGPGGMPPAGGRYIAQTTFGYMGRGGFSPDARADEYQVSVQVALDVEGPARVYLAPGIALDLLLADPEFIRQLAANPRERWTGADLTWDDERWIMELRLGDPDQALVATVDAISGTVSGVGVEVRPPSE